MKIDIVEEIANVIENIIDSSKPPTMASFITTSIEKVIFNDPATIIIWKGGEKTVVKCMEGDEYDPMKGFAMALLKTIVGDDYNKIFHEWVYPITYNTEGIFQE